MEAKLEERVSTADVRVGGNIDNVVNTEYVFYSGPTPPSDNGGGLNGTNNYDPLGTHSDFKLGETGNIRRRVGDHLQERYDFSGHDGSKPHLNYELYGVSSNFGESKGHYLGDAHRMNLFSDDDSFDDRPDPDGYWESE